MRTKLSAITLLVLVALMGCGGTQESHGRLGLSGTVTFKGQLLQKGSIAFHSEENNGFMAGDLIRGGTFNIPREQGLIPGKYRVEISSLEDTGKPLGAPGEAPVEPGKERIPEEYNTKSRQYVQVKADELNKFDFTIP